MKDLLSKRLQNIANKVYPYRHVVDVGTDHAFVPIYLAKNSLVDYVIATDVNIGPINEAKKNIFKYDLAKLIDTRCGNGLEIINKSDNLDVIIIAGMGGKLICDILNTGKHIIHLNKRLILQPNVGEDSIRGWLCENHYEIVDELIIKEDNIIYEIVVAEKRDVIYPLNDEQVLFGPILLSKKDELFKEKWQNILDYKREIYKKIPNEHMIKEIILKEIKLIESVLK